MFSIALHSMLVFFFFQKMAEHPIFTPFLQDSSNGEVKAPDNALTEGLAQLKFDPDHNSPLGKEPAFIISTKLFLKYFI